MDAFLDTLSDELCQVNTRVDHIVWWQARLGGFTTSPSPFLKASEDEDAADGDYDDEDEDKDEDEDEDASSFSDEEMTTSQWLTLCHSWQKEWVVLG